MREKTFLFKVKGTAYYVLSVRGYDEDDAWDKLLDERYEVAEDDDEVDFDLWGAEMLED